jgi:hypothetical protein
LPALLDGIADQPHPAKLAGDEQSGHIGLKVRSDAGQVYTPGLAPEDKRDCFCRAGRFAGAMSNAAGRLYENSPIVDNAENVSFRAGPSASSAAETFRQIDLRVQRYRLYQARFHGLGVFRPAARIGPLSATEIERPNRNEWDRVQGQQWVQSYRQGIRA